MGAIKKIKDEIKFISRKFMGYDPGLRKVRVNADFLDQKKLLSQINVDTIFDIGANVGQTTQKYRKLFPKANIYGFEPHQETFGLYAKNFRGDARIRPINLALSNFAGTADFFVNSHHYTNSLLPINSDSALMDDFRTIRQIEVQTETIDGFCEKRGINNISILKIDVQGGEMLVLMGATKMFKRNAVNLIYAEIEHVALYQNQPLFADIRKYLMDYGYEFYKEYNMSYSADMSPVSGDAIFISDNCGRRNDS